VVTYIHPTVFPMNALSNIWAVRCASDEINKTAVVLLLNVSHFVPGSHNHRSGGRTMHQQERKWWYISERQVSIFLSGRSDMWHHPLKH